MDFERLTQYQIESYFNKLSQIFSLNLQKYILFTRGVYIDKKNSLHLIQKKQISLHDFIYSGP